MLNYASGNGLDTKSLASCSVHAVLLQVTEPTTGGVLKKKKALEILQNSQENTCAKVSFLINLRPFQNTSGQLLPKLVLN